MYALALIVSAIDLTSKQALLVFQPFTAEAINRHFIELRRYNELYLQCEIQNLTT